MLKLTKIELKKQKGTKGINLRKKINLEKAEAIDLRKTLKVSSNYKTRLNNKYNLVK